MGQLLARANLWIVSVAVLVRAFDDRITAVRSITTAPPDQLVHYNMFLPWWRYGDSPRGFTLTPSPYFIDLLLQAPLAIIAPDFEWFSYALALAFALAIFVSLVAVMRLVLDTGLVGASIASAATLALYYWYSPFSFVVHTYTSNHTGEVFATLGLVALLHALFRPDRPRRYAALIYTVVLAGLVTSSPYFIATYCVPAAAGAVALLGTPYVTRRRLVWFFGLTGIGSVIGLVGLALIARYVWPVRADPYGPGSASLKAFWATLVADYDARACSVIAFAMVLSCALLVAARRTGRGRPAVLFMLGFFPVSAISCLGLPIKRGAFDGTYAYRYIQVPWLLTLALFVAIAAWLGCALVVAARRRGWRLPAWSPWITPVLGAAGIALVLTAQGPQSMFGPENQIAGTLRCLAAVDRTGTLHDGFATVLLARYFSAARQGASWGAPGEPGAIVLIPPADPPVIDPQSNNALWLNQPRYRGGRARLNFLATQWLDDKTLQAWRERFGAPDRTVTCPVPPTMQVDRKPSFDLWIWDRADAQQRLAEFATHDNMRSPFVPVVGAREMAIDVTWGMTADPRDSELVSGHRIWKRGVQRDGGSMAFVLPFDVPSGRYRVDLSLIAVAPPGGTGGPVAKLGVDTPRGEHKHKLWWFPIEPGSDHASFEFTVDNYGGSTSGDRIWMNLYPLAAQSIELTGMTVTQVVANTIAPFRIFR